MLKEMFMGWLFCVQVLFCKGKAWYTEIDNSKVGGYTHENCNH